MSNIPEEVSSSNRYELIKGNLLDRKLLNETF